MESQEFLAFWGWRHIPWTSIPNIDQLFWQRSTLTSLQRLLAYQQRPHGVSIISGPIGHGKSTLCRWLYQQFSPNTDDVILLALGSQIKSGGWLAPHLARYLGIHPQEDPEFIYRKLFDSLLRKRHLTIIIDQAEKIVEWEALDDIQALLQSKVYGSSPLNFILIGQTPILKNLASSDVLAQKVYFHAELQHFDAQEVGQFLHYYLKTLALSPQTLSPEAYSLIIEQANPTFHGIENVIAAALIEAFLRQQRIIQVDSIQEVLWKKAQTPELDENSADSSKQAKSYLRKKVAPKNAAGSTAALDLNSLYYKSDGNQDPEDS